MNQVAEINVTGHGKVSAKPDGIQIDLSVVSREPDYPQTLTHLDGRVSAIVDAIARAGTNVPVVTKSFEISEVWSDQYDEENRKFQGYKAVQQLTATIPLDTVLLGHVVSELARSASQPSMDITFVIRSREVIEKAARIAAANKAKEAASDLAEVTGLQLVSVKSITFIAGKSNSGSGLLRMSSLAQYDMGSIASVTPDVISHEETVHMVWQAAPKG